MALMTVRVGQEQKDRFQIELQARKSLDGNIMIFDHKEIDIVIMPKKNKIVTFAKKEPSDSDYAAQDRFFEFMNTKGLVQFGSVRGGNIYGSIEGLICESENPQNNSFDYALYGIYQFVQQEAPYYNYLESYEEMLDDYYTDPTKEDSTELGEVPQATEKGSIRPGYTYEPYWMSYMLENLQKED